MPKLRIPRLSELKTQCAHIPISHDSWKLLHHAQDTNPENLPQVNIADEDRKRPIAIHRAWVFGAWRKHGRPSNLFHGNRRMVSTIIGDAIIFECQKGTETPKLPMKRCIPYWNEWGRNGSRYSDYTQRQSFGNTLC